MKMEKRMIEASFISLLLTEHRYQQHRDTFHFDRRQDHELHNDLQEK
jgi:hypothetical protein